jgi:MoxR-like ATPase
MTKQVMIYEVKSSAAPNAKELFSKERNYFYWNNKFFKNLELGDFVFVVNKTEDWVLFTSLDKTNIPTKKKNEKTYFEDGNNEFEVSGKFNEFVRLKIIHQYAPPKDWSWKSLGSAEITYLFGERSSSNSIANRIKNIEQLLDIINDEDPKNVLSNSLNHFMKLQKENPQKEESVSTKGQTEMHKTITHIESFIKSKGFNFKREEIANFYLSLKTKPFVILAGISGTGKTQLPRLFAEAVGMSKEQVIQVPVRPDWTDASDLIGYTALNGQFISKPLTDAILKAKEFPNKPFFFILDEMNLARVEHYFSDFLSIIETRTHVDGKIITDPIITESQIKDANNKAQFEGIYWPENLYLIGTVNMDETTHPFSRKVLDRANSIEMNTVELDWLEKQAETLNPLVDFTNDHLCGKLIGSKDLSDEDKMKTKNELNELKEINDILRIADLHFAYRVRDEIIFYATHAKNEGLLKENEALDFQFMQKILPRIHGSSIRTQKVLVGLINRFSGGNLSIENPDMSIIQKNKESWFKKSKYPKSLEKLIFMLERFDEDRFTSFWV